MTPEFDCNGFRSESARLRGDWEEVPRWWWARASVPPAVVTPNSRGFTVLETVVALAMVSVALVLVAHLGYLSLSERTRSGARFAATEQVANVLEAARSMPWDQLDSNWATTRSLPADMANRLPGAKLVVEVQSVRTQPNLKHVTVELSWDGVAGVDSRPVRLETWLSVRTVGRQEAQQ